MLAMVVLLGVAVALLQRWAGSDDFRARIEREASTALRVPVKLGGLSVDLLPLPAVAVDGLQVRTQPPLTAERIEIRPSWRALLRGELEIASLLVRRAVVPQQAVSALSAAQQRKPAAQKTGAGTPPGDALALLPRRWIIEELTLVQPQRRITLDARVLLDAQRLPDAAEIRVRRGWLEGARLDLARAGRQWSLDGSVGGGSVAGKFTLDRPPAGGFLLQGNLALSGVEVSALTAPSRPLTGRMDTQTTLRAEFRDPARLADALQTQTRFTVNQAVVQGVDLAKAVRTAGTSSGGQTPLDTVAGQVVTQGPVVHLRNLVANSGLLAATGNVTVEADRSLDGRVGVDLAGGALGVPLVVGGTLDEPSVTLSRGAMIGAAVGTLAAPGPGTAAGAIAGEHLGRGLRSLLGK
ncbi:Hypothetical protein Rta_00650 [Ramlibacter tataouinensis TTB310]|uniref:AsmA-like C-terminal domain-containing protein n=1 Tax=Ramlibacter tataouinensis (strain ATCC BAA-407 / DSM 14655 / LMG 21543 / TTB310) TaxID=365046 RepID=F5Y2F1_RAMTT|nr:Hypothetical protein Rta_00650 [Ramlibacter tataouinensis TTB310]